MPITYQLVGQPSQMFPEAFRCKLGSQHSYLNSQIPIYVRSSLLTRPINFVWTFYLIGFLRSKIIVIPLLSLCCRKQILSIFIGIKDACL